MRLAGAGVPRYMEVSELSGPTSPAAARQIRVTDAVRERRQERP